MDSVVRGDFLEPRLMKYLLFLVPVVCFADVRWHEDIDYALHPNCPEIVSEALQVAIGNVTPAPESRYQGFREAVGFDYIVTIHCSDYQSQGYLPPGIEAKTFHLTLGEATRYWKTETGEIVDCDIWLNKDAKKDQLVTVLAHEWGHCLGLGHRLDVPETLMSPYLEMILSPTTSFHDRIELMRLQYGECVPVTDKKGNMFVPHANVESHGLEPVSFYVRPGLWPHEAVQDISKALC